MIGQRWFWLQLILAILTVAGAYAGEVKLTTYYPAPYGEYKRVVTKTLGVGNNTGGTFDGSDAPNPDTNEGDAWIKGNVGIGTRIVGYPNGKLHAATSNTYCTSFFDAYANNASVDGEYACRKTRGTTIDGPHSATTKTLNNDQLGAFSFWGDNGNGFMQGAFIYGIQQGDAGSYIPTKIVFSTSTATTGNTPRMVIDKDGNVGIGTTSPMANLNIQDADSGGATGQVVFRASQAYQNTFDIRQYGGSTDLVQLAAWHGEQNIAIVTEDEGSLSANTTKGIYVKSGGNVGIGTTGPHASLELFKFQAGSPTVGGEALLSSNGESNRETKLSFAPWIGRPGGYAAQIVGKDDGNYSANLVFRTAPPGSSGNPVLVDRMIIAADGNLDITSNGSTIRVPRKSTAGDPTGADGMIYYNSNGNNFRVHENGAWKGLTSGAGTSSVLYTQTTNMAVGPSVSTEGSLIDIGGVGFANLSMPRSFFTVGRTIRITMRGYWKQDDRNNGERLTLTLRFRKGDVQTGAITQISAQTFDVGKFPNDSGWELNYILTCRSVGANSVTLYGQGYFNASFNPGTPYAVPPHGRIDLVSGLGTGAITLDTTANEILQITADWLVGGALTYITSTNTVIEALN